MILPSSSPAHNSAANLAVNSSDGGRHSVHRRFGTGAGGSSSSVGQGHLLIDTNATAPAIAASSGTNPAIQQSAKSSLTFSPGSRLKVKQTPETRQQKSYLLHQKSSKNLQ